MISDNIKKTDFIINVLKRDVEDIYKTQLLIASQNIYFEGKEHENKKTGRLLNSLQNPDYAIQAQGSKFIISAKIVKHLRFLDMKKHGNWKIYNRQVWGILHNNSLRDIRNGYGDEIYYGVRNQLIEAFASKIQLPAVTIFLLFLFFECILVLTHLHEPCENHMLQVV